MKLAAEHVRYLLDYDPDTGIMTWRHRSNPKHNVKIGSVAGDRRAYGRHAPRIKIDGRKYPISTLAYLWMKGEWPPNPIDHKDLDPGNNRWKNLRPATRSQNKCNERTRRDSMTGYKGVTRAGNKFRVRVGLNGVRPTIGYFDTALEGFYAYRRAARRLHGEFARTDP